MSDFDQKILSFSSSFFRNSPPKGEFVEVAPHFYQVPLSPIHESDMEFPTATTSTSSNTNQQQHAPLLASIGPQSRLVSRSTFYISSNCDSVQDVEVQDLEVLPDTHSNPN